MITSLHRVDHETKSLRTSANTTSTYDVMTLKRLSRYWPWWGETTDGLPSQRAIYAGYGIPFYISPEKTFWIYNRFIITHQCNECISNEIAADHFSHQHYLMSAWTNGWTNRRYGDLMCYGAHYEVTLMRNVTSRCGQCTISFVCVSL